MPQTQHTENTPRGTRSKPRRTPQDMPPRVEIEWIDTQGLGAWDDVDFIVTQARATWDQTHYSVGYLIDETDDHVCVVSSWRSPTKFTAAQACDAIVIPTRNITNRRTLRP
jgi:hypothetical protein